VRVFVSMGVKELVITLYLFAAVSVKFCCYIFKWITVAHD